MLASSFFTESSALDTEAVIAALWKYRNFPPNLATLTELLLDVFNAIEFFLPQLAHMMIHIDAAVLEDLCLSLCQKSVHFALQLSFILIAAMEDFQPEDRFGRANPHSDTKQFKKCARLLQRIEKSVVTGNFSAPPPADAVVPPNTTPLYEGALHYKRVVRKSFQRKIWKLRYFRIENGVLHCYHDKQYSWLRRTIPLQNCIVDVINHPSHEHCFEVYHPVSLMRFKLYADSAEEMQAWITHIKTAAEDDVSPVNDVTDATLQQATLGLSAIQHKRHMFFRHEKALIQRLTEICEELRFMERSIRTSELQLRLERLSVPQYSYLPLCNSTDTFANILRVIPAEAHAFTTKARVPALMLFELEKHAKQKDVASFFEYDLMYAHSTAVISEGAALGASTMQSSFAYTNEVSTPCSFECMNVDTLTAKKQQFVESHELTTDDHTEASPPVVRISSNVTVDNVNIPDDGEVYNGQSELFADKIARIQKSSEYGHLPNWTVDGLIAKSNDDVRQEVFVMQLIMYCQQIFQSECLPVWLYTYRILSTSKTTGLIQLIPNAISLDALKKQSSWPGTLRGYFEATYGVDTPAFKKAQMEYVKSVAAYSIVTYVLAIKDRHNGNVMIDTSGHLIHIDFGFVFGLAPGKQFSMEKAPWKITEEMVDVMGGRTSEVFETYLQLCGQCLSALRKHTEALCNMMDIMAYESNYPAFRFNPNAIQDMAARLMPNATEADIPDIIRNLMNKSYKHPGTAAYDKFQVMTNGIAE